MTWLLLAGAAICVAALLGLEHYIPWSRILGKMLWPPLTYIVGLGTVGLVWTGWVAVVCLVEGNLSPVELVAGFWVISVAGGATVVASYKVDGWLGQRALRAAQSLTRRSRAEDASGKAMG